MKDVELTGAEREAMAAAWDAEDYTRPWHFLDSASAQAVERVFAAGRVSARLVPAGESVGESLGILAAPINLSGPAATESAWQPSRVEVDAAEATIFEAFDDGTHGREADGYYRPLAKSVLVNAHRAKLTLARLVGR